MENDKRDRALMLLGAFTGLAAHIEGLNNTFTDIVPERVLCAAEFNELWAIFTEQNDRAEALFNKIAESLGIKSMGE